MHYVWVVEAKWKKKYDRNDTWDAGCDSPVFRRSDARNLAYLRRRDAPGMMFRIRKYVRKEE